MKGLFLLHLYMNKSRLRQYHGWKDIDYFKKIRTSENGYDSKSISSSSAKPHDGIFSG
jgi:hypothetical protein